MLTDFQTVWFRHGVETQIQQEIPVFFLLFFFVCFNRLFLRRCSISTWVRFHAATVALLRLMFAATETRVVVLVKDLADMICTSASSAGSGTTAAAVATTAVDAASDPGANPARSPSVRLSFTRGAANNEATLSFEKTTTFHGAELRFHWVHARRVFDCLCSPVTA